MRNIIVLFILIVPILVSCKPEPETSFELIYKNETNSNLVLLNSYGHRDSYYTDTIFQINAHSQRSILSHREGVDDINVFPYNLVFQLIPGDSITVIFGDSLHVLHYPERTTNVYSETLDPNGVLYSESRNIYHASFYFQEKVDDNYFRGTYTFNQADLDYAIEINE